MSDNSLLCVLVIEPDEDLAAAIATDLRQAGYQALIVRDGASALRQVRDHLPHLILLNRTLPGDSGLRLCSQLRGQGIRIPVLLLIATDSVNDRAACLEAGADDYFVKPYRREDLLRMVQLYLKTERPEVLHLRFNDLVLDLTTKQARRNNREIDLTTKEFELLRYLMEHPREVLTREQILESVWGYDFVGESNVIEVYVRYLRLKIEEDGEKRLIQTVRGIGYVLREA